MGIKKMLKEDKNWFAFIVIILIWLSAVFFTVVLSRELYHNIPALIIFGTMAASEMYKYFKSFNEHHSNAGIEGWILLGVGAWFVLPGLTLAALALDWI